MEAVLGTQLAAPGRPGWWRTAWALVLGAAIGFGLLLVLFLVLGAFAGVAPDSARGDHGWPFAPDAPAAVVADLGFAAIVLAGLTVVSGWTLHAWIDERAAPSWVAAGLGLGGFGPFLVGPLGTGGAWGLLVAVVVVRFGAFAPDGHARLGVVGALPPSARRRARRLLAAVLVSGLAFACVYGVTHPVAAASEWGQSPPRLVRGVQPAVRMTFVPLQARGFGRVTLLALRPAGHAVGRTRVVAAGISVGGVVNGPEALRPRLPAPVDGAEAWFTVPRCPAPAVVVDRVDARVRSWSGTRWVRLHLTPAIRLACGPAHVAP